MSQPSTGRIKVIGNGQTDRKADKVIENQQADSLANRLEKRQT